MLPHGKTGGRPGRERNVQHWHDGAVLAQEGHHAVKEVTIQHPQHVAPFGLVQLLQILFLLDEAAQEVIPRPCLGAAPVHLVHHGITVAFLLGKRHSAVADVWLIIKLEVCVRLLLLSRRAPPTRPLRPRRWPPAARRCCRELHAHCSLMDCACYMWPPGRQ